MNDASLNLTGRMAVCSWSLQPVSPRDLVEKLAATGIRRVQLALDPLREAPWVWGDTPALFQAANLEIVSGMFGCVGEDYATLESIRATGGLAPDATWPANLAAIQSTAELAARLGLRLVTFHAGFLPHEPADPAFARMLKRLRTVAQIFADQNIGLALETGQETAVALAAFLQALNHPNLGVNFDPANMLLYDKGDPVVALRWLSPWLRQVHIKDATRTAVPGTWGAEVPAGTGEVDWPAFFAALRQLPFTGNLVIEREAGDRRVADILTARQLLERQLAP